MNISELLTNAYSPIENIRRPAEASLLNLEKQNLSEYLTSLCGELSDQTKPQQSRQLAGILLKNSVVAKDSERKKQLKLRWLSIVDEVREKIKENILKLLGSPDKPARMIACSVISKIAAVEIPENKQTNLIPKLIENIDQSQTGDLLEVSYRVLAYLCEDVPSQYLFQYRNMFLDRVSRAISQQSSATEFLSIKLAATDALYSMLHLVEDGFANEKHRQMIMSLVFMSASINDEKIQIAGLQCLIRIGELYYDYLDQHISDIFHLTQSILLKPNESLKLRVIEFQSTIGESELDIIEQLYNEEQTSSQVNNINGSQLNNGLHQQSDFNVANSDKSSQNASKIVCRNYISNVLEHLLPLLLNSLMKQNEDLLDDSQNEAMASGVCLTLIAQCSRDLIIPHILKFVQENILSTDQHKAEAALLAFGSILDGPSKEKLKPIVSQAFPLIIQQVQNSHLAIKDTAAQTIGRICDLLPQSIDAIILPKLMNVFVEGLKEQPRVAANICQAIHNLVEAARMNETAPSPLSPYFTGLMNALLICSIRNDIDDSNLLTSCYETINVLILSSSSDVELSILALLSTFIERLQKTLVGVGSGAQLRQKYELQSLLAGTIGTIMTKLSFKHIEQHVYNVLNLFLMVLNAENSTVHEEILMAVGSIAAKIGGKFNEYLSIFMPHLINGLKNIHGFQVYQICVGVIGDICRSVEDKIFPYTDEIMLCLIKALQDPEFDRNVKTHIISCIGDLALAVGGNFDRYLELIMQILIQASQIRFDNPDQDNIDYLNQLRESILETYTSIIQGLNIANKQDMFLNYVGPTIGLIDLIVSDQNPSNHVVSASLGIVGDLLAILGEKVRDAFRAECIHKLIVLSQNIKDEKIQINLKYALKLYNTCSATSTANPTQQFIF